MARNFRFGLFEHVNWSSDKKDAVDLFWEWHEYLKLSCDFSGVEDAKKTFLALKAKLINNETQDVIPVTLLNNVKKAIARYDIPQEWFFDQMSVAHHFYGSHQFQDAKELKSFIAAWEAPHAYMIAKLADAAYTWQRMQLDELAVAFFVVDSLLHLPENLEQNRVFIPLSEMQHAEVTLEQLKTGEITQGLERLLWKQTIRARDAFAQGQPLLKELDRKYRSAAKKNWLTALEYLNEIEKRKYDVWSEPIILIWFAKFSDFCVITDWQRGSPGKRLGRMVLCIL